MEEDTYRRRSAFPPMPRGKFDVALRLVGKLMAMASGRVGVDTSSIPEPVANIVTGTR
jgi:hypothetical protein